jgi:elongation factor Ts
MSISAKDVKELREITGAGMMDCKKALGECSGDKEAAVDYLRAKGLAKAAKKQGRIAADGLIGTYLSSDAKAACIVEVNCETDFVAKNDSFQKFTTDVAKFIGENNFNSVESALEGKFKSGTLTDEVNNLTLQIGEKIALRRFNKLTVDNGAIGTYLHGGKIGVLVQANATGDNGKLQSVLKDVCMHIAASDTQFINESEIDEEFKNREAEVYAAQLKEQGKPEAMIPNIVKGKLSKLASEICLLNQKFVKNPDITVAQYLKEAFENDITITSFSKFNLGEGIEKKEDNLAEEVAKMTGGN